MTIYLASPFFTESQNLALSRVEEILKRNKLDFYSPRLQAGNFGLVPPEEKIARAKEIFFNDVFNVFRCGLMLAYTDGETYYRENGQLNIARDSGTAFEMGMLYARGLSVGVMRTDNAKELIDRLHRPPLLTFSTMGHGANLMIATASRVHFPTIDHLDLFFQNVSLEVEEGKFDIKYGWDPVITHVLNNVYGVNNKLDVDPIHP